MLSQKANAKFYLYSHPYRQDDGSDPIPLQATLDSEGCLIVQHFVIEFFQPEVDLPGENGGPGILGGDCLAQVHGAFHHIRSHFHAIVGGKAQLSGQHNIFFKPARYQLLQDCDFFGALEGTGVDDSHRNKNDVFVDFGKGGENGQQGVDAKSAVSRNHLNCGQIIFIQRGTIGRA